MEVRCLKWAHNTAFFLETQERIYFLDCFSFQRSHTSFGLWPLSPSSKAAKKHSMFTFPSFYPFPSGVTYLLSDSDSCLPLIKPLWWHLRPTWTIQDKLPISRSLPWSPLQRSFAIPGNIHRFQRLRCEHLQGPFFSLTHPLTLRKE